MGLKILYNKLKIYGYIILYDNNIELWRDYVPDDVKLFLEYEQELNKECVEIYYSEKCKEFYLKIVKNIKDEQECSIYLYDYSSFDIYLIKNELYNELNDFWKKEFGFTEVI